MCPEEGLPIHLSPHLKLRAAALLDQQMWCWGCDVRRSAGNLLLAYGAQKRPAPEPRLHSAYSFHLGAGAALNLWGWGIWTARQGCGSVFVDRARFQVRYTAQAELLPQAWRKCDLPPTQTTVTADELSAVGALLFDMCQWIGKYESWLTTQIEPAYREWAIAAWPERKRHRGGVPASEVAASWIALSEMLYEELSHGWQTQSHAEETDVRQ
ncbi:MAG: hypothetical protein ACUVSX_15145 [Aggregatilineales bacterium]